MRFTFSLKSKIFSKRTSFCLKLFERILCLNTPSTGQWKSYWCRITPTAFHFSVGFL